MLFYYIELLTIPKIKYNCAISVGDFSARVPENKQLLELCYLDGGDCVCQNGSDALVCEASHLYPLIFSGNCEMYSEGDRAVKMMCVGLECEFSHKMVNSEELTQEQARTLMKELLEGNRFLLPREGISALESEWVAPYMKKLLACKPGERIGEETRALSLVMELMSRITKSSMDALAFDAHSFPTSAVAYSEMVVSYIIKNYRKKISVIDIAEEFGLTPNYLHAIFKQVKGTTIIDYLTAYRMDMAKTYIERFGLHAYEAAEFVGIDDPAYFSRLFKKMYKKSISDFKRGSK